MSLDVADRRGIDPGLGIGALERPHLALVARRGQSPTAAVARGADTLDHRVDPIAVALGVGQALEDHGGDPFADHDAVGARVEGTAATPRGEGLGLAEREIGERVLDRVHATEHDHVGRAGVELADGQVQGRQRRAAGRVHRVVGATQVEPVGDAARGHVEQETREGILGPFGQEPLATLHRGRAAPGDDRVEHRQIGAEGIAHGDLGRATPHAQDDGRARRAGTAACA